jgi:hypothetical protein
MGHGRSLVALHWRVSVQFLLVCHAGRGFSQDLPTLDDARLNAIFREASEYDLPRRQYRNGRYVEPSGIADQPPWKHPGGLESSRHSRKFRHTTGYTHDVREYRGGTKQRVTLHVRPVWRWNTNTITFELHYHPIGGWPYELRIQEKTGDGFGFDEWESYVFRPARDESDIPNCPTGQRFNVSRVMGRMRFEGVATLYPDHPIDWLAFVSDHDWFDCTGHDWPHGGFGDGWLNPQRYDGWVIGSDHTTCARCHTHAGAPVQRFDQSIQDAAFVIGGDGSFSLRPFNLETAYNGRFSKWISITKESSYGF